MSKIIGCTIVRIASTASTNNYATSQVYENEVKEGTVFLAYEQTAGRGHFTNKWESEAGKNLTFSILLRPTFLPVHLPYMLSKVICLGLESYLSHLVDDVKIKWPNDIYVGDRKICGILIENGIMKGRICQSVIGIGLNVNQERFLSDAPNPVSLKMLTSKDYGLDEVITELSESLDNYYRLLLEGKYDELDRAFLQKLYRLNEWHRYKDEAHTYTGKIIGVNKTGQLRIQEEDGPVHEYHFKEVVYL